MAPAHQHAHGAAPASAARNRGDPGVARTPAQCRSQRRDAVLHRQPRPSADPRRAPTVRHLHVGLVLGDLHPVVHLAHRMCHPAHAAPLEGAAGPAPAHSCTSRAALDVSRDVDRRGGCRPRSLCGRRCGSRRAAAAPRWLPHRAVRHRSSGRLELQCLGRARLPERDREPHLPRRARGRSHRGRSRRRLHLHRPDRHHPG